MRLTAARLLTGLAALAGAVAPAMAAPEPIPLEGLLSAPFVSELTASPAGGKLAWVETVRGVRNLWVAEPPAYRARQLSRYEADDGISIGGLEWTPDGSALVFVRGGSANRQGDFPNPTSEPLGGEQSVWWLALAGGEPQRLASGGGAAVSPRGDGVALLQKGDVHWVPLPRAGEATPPKAEPVAWVKERGSAAQLRFSPDGSRLAFVSDRGNHGFVGVYDVAAKSLRWLAPSVDEDRQPAWSPDGTRVAFVREAASSKLTLFHPHDSGQPWSIMVASAGSGESQEVFRAAPGRGSAFRDMVAKNQLLWAAGDRLVFPWERDGWLQLFSIPAQGGDPVQLTKGEFEVEGVNLTADKRSLLVSSNAGDIERRHLWRVDAAGGRVAALTRGTGIEWLPVMTSDGKTLAYVRADARRPGRVVIEVGGESPREISAPLPPEFPERSLVEPLPVAFDAADGMRIRAQLFLPPAGGGGKRRPAVIFFHGGSHRQMLLGWHNLSYYHQTYAFNQYLASRGYVVLAVNFRSGIGYGLDFRAAAGQGAAGGSELQDVLGAGLYLRQRDDVDPARIGLWGGSYGGYLTALGLARASDLFAAGVDIHGVHDWNVGIKNFIPSYDPTPEQEKLAFDSSPMAWLDGWRSPVLLIHGDDDRNVAFSETVDLVEALRARQVEVEQLVLPDEVHSFLRHASWLAAFRAAGDFFDRRLAAGSTQRREGAVGVTTPVAGNGSARSARRGSESPGSSGGASPRWMRMSPP